MFRGNVSYVDWFAASQGAAKWLASCHDRANG
jgi:hypothetical protein